MSGFADIEPVEQWIFGRLNHASLTSLVGSRIRSDVGDFGKEVGIVFQALASEPGVVQDGVVFENQFEVMVKAVGAGDSKKPVHAAFRAANARVHLARSTQDTLDISAKYVGAVNVPYNEAGVRFHQVGGLYLVTVRTAP